MPLHLGRVALVVGGLALAGHMVSGPSTKAEKAQFKCENAKGDIVRRAEMVRLALEALAASHRNAEELENTINSKKGEIINIAQTYLARSDCYGETEFMHLAIKNMQLDAKQMERMPTP